MPDSFAKPHPAGWSPRFRATMSRVRGDRRAAAAVEFAISGLAIFAFIMAIINLGLLGFTVAAMAHGVQAAARSAAVYASNQYLTTGTLSCPASSTVTGYFDKYADPPLPKSGTTANGGAPVITIAWTNSTGASPGLYLTLTAKYKWVPIGFATLGSGFTISLTSAATVLGSSAVTTSCS